VNQCKHGRDVGRCNPCWAEQRATTTALCMHLGTKVRSHDGKDHRQCDMGIGIICVCQDCSSCKYKQVKT